MSKNIFEETSKRIDIFDHYSKNIHYGEADLNMLKNAARRSLDNNNNGNSKHEMAVLKEVHETNQAKSRNHRVQIQDPHENTPAMYKIAMRIKRITEEKILKKHPSQESGSSLSPRTNKKQRDNIEHNEVKIVLNEEQMLINELVELGMESLDNGKITALQIKLIVFLF